MAEELTVKDVCRQHLQQVREMIQAAGGRHFNTVQADDSGGTFEMWNVNGRALILQVFGNDNGWEVFTLIVHTNLIRVTKDALHTWLEETKK